MDRRYYQRTKVDKEGIFFIKTNNPGKRDFIGTIVDISEGGIRIHISEEQYEESVSTIEVGSVISFQAYDEYQLYNELKQEVFMGEVEVLRIQKEKNGIFIGCKMLQLKPDLEKYISNKKLAVFIKCGHRI